MKNEDCRLGVKCTPSINCRRGRVKGQKSTQIHVNDHLLDICFHKSISFFSGTSSTTRNSWTFFPSGKTGLAVQGGKTFCASFCASLITGSRRAFLCVDCVCLLLEFWVKCTRCERLLPVKHFYLTCLLFFRRLKITLDSEQPILKEKRIISSVWGGIKGFEHF